MEINFNLNYSKTDIIFVIVLLQNIQEIYKVSNKNYTNNKLQEIQKVDNKNVRLIIYFRKIENNYFIYKYLSNQKTIVFHNYKKHIQAKEK